MKITKIVITGGPCAGKSTAMNRIHDYFTDKGYTVLFVPETATELISGGVAPWTCATNVEFQKYQMSLQLTKENIFEQAARNMSEKKILIVCDRGALDNKAYMTDEEFSEVLAHIGMGEVDLRDSYDAVFHLETTAKGAVEFYTTENNGARIETPDEAATLDDKVIFSWTGHPHLRVIDNEKDFDKKIQNLLSEISSFIGDPKPLEIERKFLIEYPDIQWLNSYPACKRVEIIQTYLNSSSDEEVRIRQRGADGSYIYSQTIKRKASEIKRVETEKRLTQSEYLELLLEADTSKRQIRKTRYCLTYENQYFEIDVYPFWNDKAILEIELSHEDEKIIFPDKINVIKEVTDEPEYKNSSLASM